MYLRKVKMCKINKLQQQTFADVTKPCQIGVHLVKPALSLGYSINAKSHQ